MPTFPRPTDLPSLREFPSLDFSRLDIRAVKLPDVKLPKVNVPDVKLPEVKMPDVKMPEVKMPDVPAVDVDRVAGVARDAAYVGVGLTVLAVQQVQVRRRELQTTIEQGVRTLATRANRSS